MQCRTIRTNYDHTISLNNEQITEWSKDKLPMVVVSMETGLTIGILTWEWFSKNSGWRKKVHNNGKKFRITVSTFLVAKQTKPKTHILRKKAA